MFPSSFNQSYTLSWLVSQIISLINLIIPVLAGFALILFFVGIIRFIARAGDEAGKQRDKEVMLWGLIALFVLFSIWGILGILCASFFGSFDCRTFTNWYDIH